MPLPTFEKCCGCIDLKTGCFIIGYFQLVTCIMTLTFTLIGLVAGGAALNTDDQKVQEAGILLTSLSIVLAVFVTLMLIFVVLLLVGLHKSKRSYIKAYLIYGTIFIVIGIVGVLGTAVSGKPHKSGDIVQQILSLLINGYLLLVINSYYRRLDQAKTGTYNSA